MSDETTRLFTSTIYYSMLPLDAAEVLPTLVWLYRNVVTYLKMVSPYTKKKGFNI